MKDVAVFAEPSSAMIYVTDQAGAEWNVDLDDPDDVAELVRRLKVGEARVVNLGSRTVRLGDMHVPAEIAVGRLKRGRTVDSQNASPRSKRDDQDGT